jgi:hypothetical protein
MLILEKFESLSARSDKGLEWYRDADEFGDFILNKHKGETGMFLPWKEFGH